MNTYKVQTQNREEFIVKASAFMAKDGHVLFYNTPDNNIEGVHYFPGTVTITKQEEDPE